MKTGTDAIKKRLRQREDMFLRRLMGMLAKMAKADGKVDAWETIQKTGRQEECDFRTYWTMRFVI